MAVFSLEERRDGAADAAPRKPCASDEECGWIDAVARTSEDIEHLCERTGAPGELARHALDADELARVDHHPDGSVLVVLRAPSGAESGDGPLRTAALSAILMHDRVLTIARAKLDIVTAAALGRSRAVRSSAGIVVALVLATAEAYLSHLRKIDSAVNALETQLQGSLRNEEVRLLLAHQKSLVHFRNGIAANLTMLERLSKDTRVFSTPQERDLLDDAMVEMRQAADMTIVSSDILGEMMDAFASIISNNLNVVMKVMTALTIVLAIPSMIAGIYGMNVALPGQHDAHAFIVVAGAALMAACVVVVLFRRAQWL